MDDPLTPGGAEDQGPPPSLICPITQELLEDPVIAADGFTYEREAIERWLGMGTNRRSPTTNAPLAHRALVPNRSLASLVHAYRGRLGRSIVELIEDAERSEDDVAKCIRQLAERGADVDAVDEAGRSVLLVAVSSKRYVVADALLDAGARVSTTDGSPSPVVALLDGEDWSQVDEDDVENPLRPASPSQLQGRRLKALARKCIERCQAEAERDERRNARLRSEEDRAARTDAARASRSTLGQLAQAGTQDEGVANGVFGAARLR